MKSFKCTVTRTDEYIIEFDENVIDQEWMNSFKEYFYNFNTLEQHAKHIAQVRARFAETSIEGYGSPLFDGRKSLFAKDDQVNKGINIKIVSEDQNCDVDVNKV